MPFCPLGPASVFRHSLLTADHTHFNKEISHVCKCCYTKLFGYKTDSCTLIKQIFPVTMFPVMRFFKLTALWENISSDLVDHMVKLFGYKTDSCTFIKQIFPVTMFPVMRFFKLTALRENISSDLVDHMVKLLGYKTGSCTLIKQIFPVTMFPVTLPFRFSCHPAVQLCVMWRQEIKNGGSMRFLKFTALWDNISFDLVDHMVNSNLCAAE
jgi:hypothetical protein